MALGVSLRGWSLRPGAGLRLLASAAAPHPVSATAPVRVSRGGVAWDAIPWKAGSVRGPGTPRQDHPHLIWGGLGWVID
jgi:hypothetical protein